MTRTIALAVACAVLVFTPLVSFAAVDAAQAEAMAKKHNCLQCHSADKKILGPAYKEVAKKYKGNKGAKAMLVKNVKAGSKGTWGQIPMPPNDKLSDAEAATLVEWILSM